MAEEIRANGYVGFDSITQQIEHKLLKRGFQFNVILVGTLPLRSFEALWLLGMSRQCMDYPACYWIWQSRAVGWAVAVDLPATTTQPCTRSDVFRPHPLS